MTITLPEPTARPKERGWDGKPRRSREFHYELGPAESGGRRVISATAMHSASGKRFSTFVVAKTVEGITETYMPYDGVHVAQEPVARYSEKALDAYAARTLAALPGLIEQYQPLREVFAPLLEDDLAGFPEGVAEDDDLDRCATGCVCTPEEKAAVGEDPIGAVTYLRDDRYGHLVQPRCTCEVSILSGFAHRQVAELMAADHIATVHPDAVAEWLRFSQPDFLAGVG